MPQLKVNGNPVYLSLQPNTSMRVGVWFPNGHDRLRAGADHNPQWLFASPNGEGSFSVDDMTMVRLLRQDKGDPSAGSIDFNSGTIDAGITVVRYESTVSNLNGVVTGIISNEFSLWIGGNT